jgi:ribulose-5-phosphate 4-epimerase/fuculose-1-phosphate aldolase
MSSKVTRTNDWRNAGSFFPLPRFETLQEERLHRKQRLAAAFRLFGKYGWDEGVAGHITARDPEFPDRFWVNPLGTPFSRMSVSKLLLVDSDGEVLEGHGTLNRAAFVIHSAIHAARPDVVAAAHAHSPYGKAWSTLGRPIDPITQDACPFFEDHAVYEDYGGVVADPDEGHRIAATLGQGRAVFLQNHGILTVGGSVDTAVWWFISLERNCQVQIAAQSAGTPRLIDPAVAREFNGGGDQERIHRSGWIHFQPLYDQIVHEQPDLLL